MDEELLLTTMLRSFPWQPVMTHIGLALEDFGFKHDHTYQGGGSKISVLRFEVITPDSMMWRLLIDDDVYYLYAEDFIDSLGQVRDIFNRYLESEQWQLVPVKEPGLWADASPVTYSDTYKEPEDSAEIMKYATTSGYDFVFLCKAEEHPDHAMFSDAVARGFVRDVAPDTTNTYDYDDGETVIEEKS